MYLSPSVASHTTSVRNKHLTSVGELGPPSTRPSVPPSLPGLITQQSTQHSNGPHAGQAVLSAALSSHPLSDVRSRNLRSSSSDRVVCCSMTDGHDGGCCASKSGAQQGVVGRCQEGASAALQHSITWSAAGGSDGGGGPESSEPSTDDYDSCEEAGGASQGGGGLVGGFKHLLGTTRLVLRDTSSFSQARCPSYLIKRQGAERQGRGDSGDGQHLVTNVQCAAVRHVGAVVEVPRRTIALEWPSMAGKQHLTSRQDTARRMSV